MRLKSLTSLILLALSLTFISTAAAQSPTVEWTAWNAQITAHAGSAPLDVAETQIIKVLSGTLHAGTRDFSQPVNVQAVYLAVNGGQPQQLAQGSSPGTYSVSNSNGDVIVDYQLPQAANAGDSFAVQINFSVNPPTAGLIDWNVVPASHPGTVNSSKLTINFPDGQAPDASFVRVPQGSGTVSASGSSIVIQSQGAIPANQPFEVQAPFGAGVGQPGNSGSAPIQNAPVQNAPIQNAPSGGTSNDFGGLGNILPILCIIGLLVVLGGGGLLRGLLGGFLGGGGLNSGGGIFGGGNSGGGGIFGGGNSGGSSPFGGSSGGRGFRQSSNQNREVPTVNNDKRGGGGASFR